MAESIPDNYLTLGAGGVHEIKIKGSRFIALGYPVETEKAAMAILDEIRKKEHAATHHCYAYVVGLETEKFKYSDDGEPSGTAGKPIYQAITGRHLKNVIIAVVRYYGGTKLGTGGLTRAYSQAATELLDKLKMVEKLICDQLHFVVPFSYYDLVMRIINKDGYRIISRDFAEQVTLDLEIRKSHTDDFVARMVELTGGQVEISKNG